MRSHGAWWVDASGLRDKRICVGALLGVWGSTRLFLLGSHVGWLLMCGWLCVGVVLCENCIVDASIFLFCVLVFVPVCLCVRVFCYGRMVDALAC